MAKVMINRVDAHEAHALFSVYIDNYMMGKLKANEELCVDILPGRHTLWCKCGVLTSRKINFKVLKDNLKFEIVSNDNALSYLSQTLSLSQDFMNVRQDVFKNGDYYEYSGISKVSIDFKRRNGSCNGVYRTDCYCLCS